MASHIPLLEEDRVIGLDGKPLAPLPINGWAGLPFEIHPHMQKGEVAHRYNPHPLLLVRLGAHGRSRIRSGSRVYDLSLAPGQVDVFSSGFLMDHGWWDCTPGEVLAVEVDPERVRSYVHDDAGAVEPRTLLATRDPILERLCGCIRAEVDAGCPSGKLFAEGISLALLSRLRSRYAAAEKAPHAPRTLSTRQLQRAIDFIDINLGSDLSVARLSAQLAMSPYTFAKLFKATVDATPHNFVLSRRVRRAEMLLGGDMSLSEIALATGFASQSHFTEAFRRRTGRTPLTARRHG
ncbi:MAG TPA: AraC family transcriptional regulator [Caldimonas sp.]|jgi:AraC family transcriptional regulator